MDAASRRARPPHIVRRGDTLYLRVRVPRDLISRLGSHAFPHASKAVAERRLSGYGVEFNALAPATEHTLLIGLARALAEQQQRLLLHRLEDPLFREDANPTGVPNLAPAGPTVRELADYYLSMKKPLWTAKTFKSNQHKVEFLVEHFRANRRGSLIRSFDVAAYRDAFCASGITATSAQAVASSRAKPKSSPTASSPRRMPRTSSRHACPRSFKKSLNGCTKTAVGPTA